LGGTAKPENPRLLQGSPGRRRKAAQRYWGSGASGPSGVQGQSPWPSCLTWGKMFIFRTKPITSLLESAEPDAHGHKLHRTLGLRNLVAFGVGSAVGVSLFVQTGPEAATHAGPAVALSFVLASIACLFAALCYAEFAGLVPVAGSAYSYAYATLGEGVAWMIGWCLLLEYLMSGSLVAIGWSQYFTATLDQFGIHIPEALTGAPITVIHAKEVQACAKQIAIQSDRIALSGKLFDLPAVSITLFVSWLIMRGTSLSARVNDIVVGLKVLAIVAIVIGAVAYIHPHNWVPFIPKNTCQSGHFGVSGVMRAAAVLFFAYVGFDSISTLGQETKNPQRTIPFALLISLAICVVLYVSVSMVMTGIADYRTLDVGDPIAEALKAQAPHLDWARWCVSIVAVFGLISVLLVTLIGQVRIFYAMGRDGLLPPAFALIHPKYKTPYIGSIVTGVGAALFAGLFPLDLLGDLVSIGTLLAFAVVSIGVLVLRRTMPHAHRPFRTPFMPFTPIAAVLSCVALMLSLSNGTWWRLALWLVIGAAVYAGYGMRHSKLRVAGLRA
jgi:APA family basic amino acid/polyamine antiporter